MNLGSDYFTELRSEEVQELLTRPPKWLLRWGVTVVLLIILLVFYGAWMVHYPDVVQASFKLTSANVPKAILSRNEGRLTRLFVQDAQAVKKGKTLAYLESTARHEEIIQLSGELDKAWQMASHGNLFGLNRLKLANYHQLGELQNAYQTFEQTRLQLQASLAKRKFCYDRKSTICRL